MHEPDRLKKMYVSFHGVWNPDMIEFTLNIFTEFSEFNDKNIVITVKGLKPSTCCVRDQDATCTTVLARHVRDKIFKLTPIHASLIYLIP